MALTVTLNDVVAVNRALSVAVQVTVETPIGNSAPDAGTQATLGVPLFPVATGVEKLTTAFAAPGAVLAVTLPGVVGNTGDCAPTRSKSRRFWPVLTTNASSGVNRSAIDSTEPGEVPSALFVAVIGPEIPPVGPNVAAPASTMAPLFQLALTTE